MTSLCSWFVAPLPIPNADKYVRYLCMVTSSITLTCATVYLLFLSSTNDNSSHIPPEAMVRGPCKLFRGAILGAPGSGKGTISEKIVDRYKLDLISVGDLFRMHVQTGTDMGKQVQQHMDKGELVPDNIVVDLVMEELDSRDRSWLIDGFPRNRNQAEILMKRHPVDVAINVVVPFKVIIDRIQGRWIHLPSGRVYNTDFKPPKIAGLDDITGEPLIQREDDKPESLQRRLKLYSDGSEPVLEVFKKYGVLEEFHGTTSLEIWKQLVKVLDVKVPPSQ